jgi:hypothetical protein
MPKKGVGDRNRVRDFIGRGMPTTQGRVGSGGGTLKRELV